MPSRQRVETWGIDEGVQIPVLKVVGLNPNGITIQNPQDSEYQFLADFSIYIMHHICTTKP
jgi:hypothetical protein